jgi:hypothetical protein
MDKEERRKKEKERGNERKNKGNLDFLLQSQSTR